MQYEELNNLYCILVVYSEQVAYGAVLMQLKCTKRIYLFAAS